MKKLIYIIVAIAAIVFSGCSTNTPHMPQGTLVVKWTASGTYFPDLFVQVYKFNTATEPKGEEVFHEFIDGQGEIQRQLPVGKYYVVLTNATKGEKKQNVNITENGVTTIVF